ncbi:hypothetical protein N9N67_04175 [Bacteriovoracaceae bacterium]|nr:hypothetical protein [Bacteriovoracaceae bacterium]
MNKLTCIILFIASFCLFAQEQIAEITYSKNGEKDITLEVYQGEFVTDNKYWGTMRVSSDGYFNHRVIIKDNADLDFFVDTDIRNLKKMYKHFRNEGFGVGISFVVIGVLAGKYLIPFAARGGWSATTRWSFGVPTNSALINIAVNVGGATGGGAVGAHYATRFIDGNLPVNYDDFLEQYDLDNSFENLSLKITDWYNFFPEVNKALVVRSIINEVLDDNLQECEQVCVKPFAVPFLARWVGADNDRHSFLREFIQSAKSVGLAGIEANLN